jgi:ABC-type spermidine/putrescine transport system permease subunit II
MGKRDLFTKILAWIGTLGVCAVLLLPAAFAVTRYFESGRFNFDWLLPMELSPVVLVCGLLLFWGALRAKSHSRPVAGGMLLAIVMFIASMVYAVWSGLASGETEAAGTPWMIATAIIILSELGMLIVAVSGISLLRALKKS